ncbi:MAG: hypothetical protein M3680_00150 [Myxococcota bacterium]|nr:hypothetical protein [Myxococcota bacterium]
MNEQSNMIKQALARAISSASDTTLKTAASQNETQFPPSTPFTRSTW